MTQVTSPGEGCSLWECLMLVFSSHCSECTTPGDPVTAPNPLPLLFFFEKSVLSYSSSSAKVFFFCFAVFGPVMILHFSRSFFFYTGRLASASHLSEELFPFSSPFIASLFFSSMRFSLSPWSPHCHFRSSSQQP